MERTSSVALPNLRSERQDEARVLRVILTVLSVQLVGLAGIVYLRGSALPAATDTLVIALAAGLALALLAGPSRHASVWVSILLFAGLSVTGSILDDTVPGRLSIVSAGVRALLPVALLLWIQDRNHAARLCLRVGIALTFIGHGIEALVLTPTFVELIHSTSLHLLGTAPSFETVASALRVIGAVDIGVGLLVGLFGVRVALAYMVAWGFITACSRMTAHGWSSWPEVAYRTAHWVVPLVLLRSTRGRRVR